MQRPPRKKVKKKLILIRFYYQSCNSFITLFVIIGFLRIVWGNFWNTSTQIFIILFINIFSFFSIFLKVQTFFLFLNFSKDLKFYLLTFKWKINCLRSNMLCPWLIILHISPIEYPWYLRYIILCLGLTISYLR